jgi:hypothetical protein
MADPQFIDSSPDGGRISPESIDATGATLGHVLTAVSDGSGGQRAGYAAAAGGGGAPTTAQYVTLATDATLTNERVLTAGSGISITDGGAGNPVTIAATGGGGSPGSNTTLTDTTGLRFHFKAAAATKTGRRITSIADSSGAGATAVSQGSVSAQPFYVIGHNNQPAMQFPGAAQLGNASVPMNVTNDYLYFVVFNPTQDPQGNAEVFTNGGSGNGVSLYVASSSLAPSIQVLHAGVAVLGSSLYSPRTVPCIVTVSRVAGTTSIRRDGLAATVSGPTASVNAPSTGFFLGYSGVNAYFRGLIYEVGGYNIDKSAGIAAIEAELAATYDIDLG